MTTPEERERANGARWVLFAGMKRGNIYGDSPQQCWARYRGIGELTKLAREKLS